MKIHLNREGRSLGQFLPHVVRDGYTGGKFLGTDLAWQEGMPSWKPLAEVIDQIAPADSGEALAPKAEAQDGPPWEQRESMGFFTALLETVRLVLLEPGSTFSNMKQRGGYGVPVAFLFVLSIVGVVVQEFYNLAFRYFGGSFLQKEQFNALIAQLGGVTPLGVLWTILIMPVFMVIGTFLGAGIVHFCLMLVGGANRPYEATFRVLAYATGATALLNFIPGCGVFLAAVWGLVVEIIGIAKVHQIGAGRAALAIFLPSIVCCGLIVLMILAAGGLASFWPGFLDAMKEMKPQ